MQLGVALLVVVAGFVYQVAALEWCALILCITIVFTAEGLNTALETLADALHPERIRWSAGRRTWLPGPC